jgi:hypothetical protein
MGIETQKAENRAELKKAKAILLKAQAAWKKAWAEKSEDLRAVWDAVTEAGDDVAYLDYQRWLLNKPVQGFGR